MVARPGLVPISTNEGAASDGSSCSSSIKSNAETGGARYVAQGGCQSSSHKLTFADRSGLTLAPIGSRTSASRGPRRVREALQRVVAGLSTHTTAGSTAASPKRVKSRTRTCHALRAVGRGNAASMLRRGRRAGVRGAGRRVPASGGTTPRPAVRHRRATDHPRAEAARQLAVSARAAGSAADRHGHVHASGTMQAESTWRVAQMTSSPALPRCATCSRTRRVGGDKTVILISGGWPLEQREEVSAIDPLASAAAAARVTLFSVFVPANATRLPRLELYCRDGRFSFRPAANTGRHDRGGSFRARSTRKPCRVARTGDGRLLPESASRRHLPIRTAGRVWMFPYRPRFHRAA